MWVKSPKLFSENTHSVIDSPDTHRENHDYLETYNFCESDYSDDSDGFCGSGEYGDYAKSVNLGELLILNQNFLCLLWI